MVYCSRCGREVDPLWTHCPYCGAPLAQAAQQPVPEKRKDRRKLVAALVGLLGLLGGGYVVYRYYGDEIMAIIESLSKQAGQPTITKTTTFTQTTELTTSQSSSEAVTTTSQTTSSPATTSSATTTSSASLTTSTTVASTTSTSPTTTTYVIPGLPERDWEAISYPYIWVGGQAYYNDVETVVINKGDAPSFYTVLELYQGPIPSRAPDTPYIAHPLNSFRLTWRKVVTLSPGQRLDFDLSGVPPIGDVLIWVCYDPLLDPKRFRMDSDAEVRSIWRNSFDRERHVFVMGRRGLVEE